MVDRSLARVLTTLAALSCSACLSYAPPIRADHYGAPGRMDEGMVEVGGELVYGPEFSGGPRLGYGVTESTTLEGGAEIDRNYRAVGWAGVRYTPLRPEGRERAFVLDVEGGAGAGVGGRRCVDSECESAAQNLRRPAGGGFLGLGVGGKIRFFSPWLRMRTQLSGAQGVPATFFFTALTGVQFDITELAHIYAGTGVVFVGNELFREWGWVAVNGGLSFTIPTARTQRANHRAR